MHLRSGNQLVAKKSTAPPPPPSKTTGTPVRASGRHIAPPPGSPAVVRPRTPVPIRAPAPAPAVLAPAAHAPVANAHPAPISHAALVPHAVPVPAVRAASSVAAPPVVAPAPVAPVAAPAPNVAPIVAPLPAPIIAAPAQLPPIPAPLPAIAAPPNVPGVAGMVNIHGYMGLDRVPAFDGKDFEEWLDKFQSACRINNWSVRNITDVLQLIATGRATKWMKHYFFNNPVPAVPPPNYLDNLFQVMRSHFVPRGRTYQLQKEIQSLRQEPTESVRELFDRLAVMFDELQVLTNNPEHESRKIAAFYEALNPEIRARMDLEANRTLAQVLEKAESVEYRVRNTMTRKNVYQVDHYQDDWNHNYEDEDPVHNIQPSKYARTGPASYPYAAPQVVHDGINTVQAVDSLKQTMLETQKDANRRLESVEAELKKLHQTRLSFSEGNNNNVQSNNNNNQPNNSNNQFNNSNNSNNQFNNSNNFNNPFNNQSRNQRQNRKRDSSSRFKGACFICGDLGHKCAVCPLRVNNVHLINYPFVQQHPQIQQPQIHTPPQFLPLFNNGQTPVQQPPAQPVVAPSWALVPASANGNQQLNSNGMRLG